MSHIGSGGINEVFVPGGGTSGQVLGKTASDNYAMDWIDPAAGGTGGADGLNRISAGTQIAATLATVLFADSNGISFGMSNNSVITAAHNALTSQSVQTQNQVSVLGSTGNISFQNGNGVTFGANASTITASHNGLTSQSNQAFSAPGGSSAFQTLVFTNSQGVSFSNSNGSLVGSVRTDYASSDHSHGNPTLNLTNLSGTTASNSAGFTLSLSAVNALTSQSNQAFSAQGGSSAFQTLSFTNSNGVSFSNTNGSVWASVETSYAASNHSHGNPTLALTNLTGTTASASNGFTLSLSAAAPGGGGNFSAGVSNVGNTVGDTGITGTRLVFAGGNNVTLSQVTDANGATVTISGANAGGAQTGISGIANSETTYSSGSVTFSALGAITIRSTTGQQFQFSVNSQSVVPGIQTIAFANTTFTTGAVSFSNANGISFGSSGAQVTASYTVPTQTNQTGAVYGSSQTYGQSSSSTYDARSLSLVGSGGISVGWSAGSLLISGQTTAAQTAQTQSNVQGIIVSNTTYRTGDVSFSNLNGISFGSNGANVVTASYTVPTQTAQTLGLYASSQTTGQSSSSTVDARSFSIVGQGNISVGLSAGSFIISQTGGAGGGGAAVSLPANGASRTSGGAGYSNISTGTANFFGNNLTLSQDGASITFSANAPGAAAENNWMHLLGANTAGNTTASGSTIGFSGIGVTLSGTNGSVVNISAPATSSLSATGQVSISVNGSTISIGVPGKITRGGYAKDLMDRELLGAQIGNNQLFIQPLDLIDPVKFDRIVWPNSYIATSNQSGSVTLTLQVGIYTRNVSTLSLLSSTSSSYAATNSGTVGSYSLYAGIRHFPIASTGTLTDGNYWLGFLSRTTTGGAAGMTFSNLVASNINVALSGNWSQAANASHQYVLGMGSFNTTTTALPASLAFTAINGSAAVNLRPVIYQLVSGTI